MALSEFLEQLIVKLQKENVQIPRDKYKWGELFYRLYEEENGFRPDFLKKITIEWDGPGPVVPEVQDSLRAICVHACRPDFERVVLTDYMLEYFSKEFENSGYPQEYLTHTAKLAKKYFTS
jgi:hypothetical protein